MKRSDDRRAFDSSRRLGLLLLAVSLCVSSGWSLTSAPAQAGPYEPPRQFQEGTRFISDLGGSACAPKADAENVGNSSYWGVGAEPGECFAGKAEFSGLKISGGCRAFGDLTQPSSQDGYLCGFEFSRGSISNAGSCFWGTIESEQKQFHPSEFWHREYEDGTFSTLSQCVEAQGSDPLEARCDVYWVKPRHALVVAAPGVLANDVEPAGLPLRAVVDQINFGVADHPYKLNSATGALSFRPNSTPGGRPFVARITYHVEGAFGKVSGPAAITIYIQSSEPSAAKLDACSGKSAQATHGKKKAKRTRVHYEHLFRPLIKAEGGGVIPYIAILDATLVDEKGKDSAFLYGTLKIEANTIKVHGAGIAIRTIYATTSKGRKKTIAQRPPIQAVDPSRNEPNWIEAEFGSRNEHIDLGGGETIKNLHLVLDMGIGGAISTANLECSFVTTKCDNHRKLK